MRGDGIEADVGEEDDGRAGQHAHGPAAGPGLSHDGVAEEAEPGVAKGREGMPVGGIDVASADDDHEKDDGQLQDDDGGVDAGAFLDAFDQDDR